MLQQYASCIVDFLYQGATLDKAKRAIYQYGMELTLSMTAAVLSILLLAAFLGNFFGELCFSLFLFRFDFRGVDTMLLPTETVFSLLTVYF